MNGTLAAIMGHWPEYLMEAFGLGVFMVSACGFGVLLFHPDSYLDGFDHSIQNILMGVAMGSTAVAIFKSPWGKRSGAHINPVVTLTFYRLGKISGIDAISYSIAQFAGASIGVLVSWSLLGSRLTTNEINFVATVPGMWGRAAAFAGEFIIAFVMMSMVLYTSNHKSLHRLTPYFAGVLVALYVAIESPVSGMSINPARTFGSAVFANTWTGWWIYFTAPILAMLAAAEVFVRTRALKKVLCAKLDHSGAARCIFNCQFADIATASETKNDVAKTPLSFKPIKGLF